MLWENPKPSDNFTAQTITIDNIENYDVIFIDAKYSKTQEFTMITAIMNAKLNSGCKLLSNDSAKYSGARNVFILEPTIITFDDSKWGTTVYNDCLIPIKIYGIIF